MSLSCAKELIFILISYIFLLDGIFQEKVPGWEVPNTGKCRTCRTSDVLVMSSSDLREASQTVLLLSSVARGGRRTHLLYLCILISTQANETSLWGCLPGRVNSCPSPKHLPLLNFGGFAEAIALVVITDLIISKIHVACKKVLWSLGICCPAIYRLQLWQDLLCIISKILGFYSGQIVVYSFADSVVSFRGGHKAAPEPGRALEGAADGCQELSL